MKTDAPGTSLSTTSTGPPGDGGGAGSGFAAFVGLGFARATVRESSGSSAGSAGFGAERPAGSLRTAGGASVGTGFAGISIVAPA
jgi:hypothetical protein